MSRQIMAKQLEEAYIEWIYRQRRLRNGMIALRACEFPGHVTILEFDPVQ